MDADLQHFYEQRSTLCKSWLQLVQNEIRRIGYVEGYTNKEMPESVLRDALDYVCEFMRRDLAARRIYITADDYRLLQAWTFEQVFGEHQTRWIKK